MIAQRFALAEPQRGESALCSGTAWSNWRTSFARTLLSGGGHCDRTVISEAQNLDEHRGLRTHTE